MPRTVDLIQKKRDGLALSRSEIRYLIEGYTNGSIPDYQMSAWAMAVYFQGMSDEETAELTLAMAESGDQLDLSAIYGIKVDKHSTGGVGDTATLVLAPLVASVGIPVAKMSGRGLGHTGGTIDKLEAIPGFSTELSSSQFVEQVNRIGIALIGQSGDITPADKQLYGLRDVTGTVHSIPLIASSIMSKKIASGTDAIVLDVKVGSGAFMKSVADAKLLAEQMVRIGVLVHRETIAVLSRMEQPLGWAVGNTLEVQEAADTLAGRGPKDLEELVLTLGAHMVIAGKKAANIEEAKAMLIASIKSGQALETFQMWVAAQGGKWETNMKLPIAAKQTAIVAETTGFVTKLEAESIGRSSMMLGAGRETKDSIIDLTAGIVLKKKIGDRITQGEVMAELHYNPEHADRVAEVVSRVQSAFTIAETKAPIQPLIIAEMSQSDETETESS